ncbi:MAG: TlpA family protein disulfide reductase [Nitrospirae bacterium]|nr:TlpA family protein disulfide reductase [Nitrospirota bacterium]
MNRTTLINSLKRAFIFLFMLAPLLSGCTLSEEPKAQATEEIPKIAKVGFTAPDFELKSLKGEVVSLRSVRGKITLINFWATWCEPCRAEMPSMEALYKSFSRSDFEILAVSSDEDGIQSVQPFQEAFHLSFPLLLDETLHVSDLYLVRSIPTSILIDRKGVITNRFFGAVDWEDPKQKNLVGQLIRFQS